MTQNELFIIPNGEVYSKEHRHSVLMLTKVLFRLHVIDEEQALNIATKFRILFV